jgi:hypothetical protein
MAGIMLLDQARAAGLEVWADGGELLIRGPTRAAPLAEALLAHKAEVLAALATRPRCWWDGPPWHGQITVDEFRAIVARYVAHYGEYRPDLPEREPALLAAWLDARGSILAP